MQLIQYNACFMKVRPPQYSLNLQVCDSYILAFFFCACTPASASMIFSMVLVLMSTNETINSTVGGTCIYNLRIIPSFLMIPNSSIAPKIVSVRMQPQSSVLIICTQQPKHPLLFLFSESSLTSSQTKSVSTLLSTDI